MIGSRFQNPARAVTRVDWIKSDGESFIDLGRAIGRDGSVELDTQIAADSAPSCVFGATDGADSCALRITANPKSLYAPIEDDTVTESFDFHEDDGFGDDLHYVGTATVRYSRDAHGKYTGTYTLAGACTPDYDPSHPWPLDETGYLDEDGTASWYRPDYPGLEESGEQFYDDQSMSMAAGGIVFTGEWYVSAEGGAEFAGVFPVVNGARRHLLYDGIDRAPYSDAYPDSEFWPAAYFKVDRLHVFSKLDTTLGRGEWDVSLPALNAYLFACNASGAAEEICSSMKVYGVKIFEDGRTVASLKPAVRNGTAGLYDLLSGRFLANAGLGELLCGNDDEDQGG